ncbi:hypothetical protein [Xenorhabdus budapestensis]|uniref:Uncharacterized protein n=1 Tax=Xenorhabdus budapestensis TaxID=290110 RepID=A0A2D0IL49_XENBU|nr:hypothetical protein [Xenorhabdus budapestensis]PHM22517.1 hypothetical protein Xbud_03753 [Xenorhabdus budapestensis]
MSEKAIELELEKSEDIAALLAKVKNPSQITGTHQDWGAFGRFALIIDTRKTDVIHTDDGLSLVIEKIESLLKTPVNIVWQYI